MGGHIIVIDDDAETCSIYEAYLMHHGFSVKSLSTAVGATDRVSAAKPAAVILDLHLPELSGLDLLEAWKGDREMRQVPVICLTAMADTETRDRAKALGCTAFVTKPAAPGRLLQLLKDITPAD